jgi:hypothetical protein
MEQLHQPEGKFFDIVSYVSDHFLEQRSREMLLKLRLGIL